MLIDSSKGLLIDKIKEVDILNYDLKCDTGKIIEIDGQKIGVYKSAEGQIYPIKPICTHLGCLLNWNQIDKTWDCPCHGSRFDYLGKNISDPAFEDLERIEIDREKEI